MRNGTKVVSKTSSRHKMLPYWFFIDITVNNYILPRNLKGAVHMYRLHCFWAKRLTMELFLRFHFELKFSSSHALNGRGRGIFTQPSCFFTNILRRNNYIKSNNFLHLPTTELSIFPRTQYLNWFISF